MGFSNSTLQIGACNSVSDLLKLRTFVVGGRNSVSPKKLCFPHLLFHLKGLREREAIFKAVGDSEGDGSRVRFPMDSASPPGHINSPMRAENDRKEVQGLDSLKKGLEVDQVRSVDSKGASWVEVAQEKKVLKKYDVEVSSKDGIHKVEIPDEVLENSTPLWEDFVVGKFLDLAFHVAKVHMVLNKIWKYGDSTTKVDVYEVNPTTMRFKVSSQKAREKIFRRGMWNIACVPMVVTKWTPRSEEEKREEEAIPMWVHLEKVPLHMYSWEGISFFTSTVGYPVKLHPETIACTNLEVAKVFVKVDVSKLLPKKITFSKDKKQFTVKYYYPWLPARCKTCDK